jgi:hypothetical protein
VVFTGDQSASVPQEIVTFDFSQLSITNRSNGAKACFNVKQGKSC